jgi:hypothetical protein
MGLNRLSTKLGVRTPSHLNHIILQGCLAHLDWNKRTPNDAARIANITMNTAAVANVKRGTAQWSSGGTFSRSSICLPGGTTVFSLVWWMLPIAQTVEIGNPIGIWEQADNSYDCIALDMFSTQSLADGPWSLRCYRNASFGATDEVNIKNMWVHIALIVDGTNMLVYRNGAYLQTISCAVTIPAVTTGVKIGTTSNGTRWLNGYVGDFMVFNRTLSAGEVANIYNRQKARYL